MNNHTDAVYIRQWVELIETRWQRGPSREWKSYDFEKLSEEIFEATGAALSISTLKRIFGKVSYNNIPSVFTLNTLARFAGFEDWNAFKRRVPVSMSTQDVRVVPGTDRTIAGLKKIIWWPLLIIPVAALAYLFISSTKPPRRGSVNPSAFSFSSNKVLTEGVPNSVVFHYDASAASSDDSIFIVQDWDMRRRTPVSKTGHAHSAIYYYPGYFNAKLVVDTQIVQTHGLLIGSGGWLAMAEREAEPFYFKKEEYSKENGVVVDTALLTKNHLTFYPRAPWISICYIKDMGPLPVDNFAFETTLKSDDIKGAEACQRAEVFIHCKNDVVIVPLSAPACIGDLSLYVLGKEIKSREADLSGFGADLRQWTTLKIETVNKRMQITINNRPVYALDFSNPPTDIVGVQYRFQGGGSVKDTRFICQGRTIELR